MDFWTALNENAPGLGALAGLIVASTGAITYAVTSRFQSLKIEKDKEQGRSGLVADALALQDAAHAAYEQAQDSADKANDEAKMTRAEFAKLRKEIEQIRDELRHWRSVAEAGRDASAKAGNPNPFWFNPYANPQEA